MAEFKKNNLKYVFSYCLFFPYFSLSTINYEKFNIQKHSFTSFSMRITSNLLYISKEGEEGIYDLEKKHLLEQLMIIFQNIILVQFIFY